MLLTNYHVELPWYLDDYIFKNLRAIYRKSGPVFVSNGWDRTKTLEYLGTYFPRSYSESLCIFSDYFQIASQKWSMKEELCIFDLGCGTGGEIIGLIDAIRCKLSNLKRVVVKAVDGNPHAVEFCRNIIEYYKTQVGQGLTIDADILGGTFSNYGELRALASCMGNTFDIIMSFKALNEVILTGSWGARNPYKDFLDTFSSHLSDSGVLCMAEVDTPVELMDCPERIGERACDPGMEGRCHVRELLKFLYEESKNGIATVNGKCCRTQGAVCSCLRNSPFAMIQDRACALQLSKVFYRDFMSQAALKWPFMTEYHNFESYWGGREQEKRFYITHSNATDDNEGLFWSISTVHPFPNNEDVPSDIV